MRKYLLFLVVIIIHSAGFAQQQVIYDSSSVAVRAFNKAKIDEYKSTPEFQYDKMLEPPASLWDRFWDYVWSRIAELLSTTAGQNTFVTILVLIAVALAVFAILKMMGMTRVGLFSNKNASEALAYTVHDENIHAIPFEQAIEQAINQGNLRLAVRLLYLQTLKILSDKQLISWQINKTNISYIQELQGMEYQSQFIRLTLQFENNWYGDRPIDKEQFNRVREEFNQFNRGLK